MDSLRAADSGVAESVFKDWVAYLSVDDDDSQKRQPDPPADASDRACYEPQAGTASSNVIRQSWARMD